MLSRKRFLLWWTAATALAWSLPFYLIVEEFSPLMSYSLLARDRAAYILGLTFMATTIGTGQGLVLRRVWQGGLYWLPATAGGTLLGALTAEFLFQAMVFNTRGWLNAMLIVAPSVALAQWWTIRRANPRGRWLIIKLIALTVGGILGFLFMQVLVAFSDAFFRLIGLGGVVMHDPQDTVSDLSRVLAGLVGAFGNGAVVGFLTGLGAIHVIWRAIGEPSPQVSAEAPQPGRVATAARKYGGRIAWLVWVVVCSVLLGGIVVLEARANQSPERLPADVEVRMERFALTDGAGSVEMVYIPAGTFIMGEDDPLAEEPRHRVYLDAFWIDRLEVSNAKYARCVQAGVCTLPRFAQLPDYGSEFPDPADANLPVQTVTWHDAAAFCEWRGARLPADAEWEKAARGTDGRLYPWGNTFYAGWVNYCDTGCSGEYADFRHDDGYDGLAPVDAFPGGASPYGALNMVGNVWEWVAEKDRQRSGEEIKRAYRGGSFYDDLRFMRLFIRRYEILPEHSHWTIGLRCARSPGAEP